MSVIVIYNSKQWTFGFLKVTFLKNAESVSNKIAFFKGMRLTFGILFTQETCI